MPIIELETVFGAVTDDNCMSREQMISIVRDYYANASKETQARVATIAKELAENGRSPIWIATALTVDRKNVREYEHYGWTSYLTRQPAIARVDYKVKQAMTQSYIVDCWHWLASELGKPEK